MVKYIVYQTVNLVNGKIYIGVHKTHTPERFDGYLGCDVDINRPQTFKHPKWPFQFAVVKYGFKNFRRTTLQEFDTEEEAYALEKQLVNEDFIKRNDTYNVYLGGIGGAAYCRCKEIHMYDLDGNYIKSFKSTWDAVKYINPECKSNHIARAIKQGHHCMGYQFSYEKVKNMPKHIHKTYERKPTEIRPVGKYTYSGELVKIYPHTLACVQDGYKNVKLVLQGKRKSCKGYTFKYMDKD